MGEGHLVLTLAPNPLRKVYRRQATSLVLGLNQKTLICLPAQVDKDKKILTKVKILSLIPSSKI